MKRTLLLLAFVAMWQSVFAYDFSAVAPSGQRLYYRILSGGGATVTYPGSSFNRWSGYSKPTGDLTIPNSVTYGGTTYAVTSIGNAAFIDCSGLTSVTIPNSVTSIGSEAFRNCSGLTTVHFNADSCTSAGGSYSNRVFYGCHNITSFTFGNNVKIIPDYLCYMLSGLTSVTIPNSVISIGREAFRDCSGLTTVHFNADSCTYAGGSYYDYRAFIGCHNITTFTFGNNVKIIPSYLCYDMDSLTSVTIPNSVTSIGREAFKNCSGLTTVHFNADSCTYAGGSYRAFPGCHNITTFTFGNNVKIIPDYLCYEMGSLTSVTIPNSVTSIGNYAFSGCSGLTLVTIPNSVTSIGMSAFSGCSGLTSVTIPNSVTSIGERAFSGCSGLMSVTIPNSVTSIGVCAFGNCIGLRTVSIGRAVSGIGTDAFKNCSTLTQVTLHPSTPPTLGSNAFINRSSLVFRVHCDAYNAYYSASGWTTYRNRLQSVYPSYSINAIPSNSDRGTTDIVQQGSRNVACDSTTIIQATPAANYHFLRWDNGNTFNPDTLHLTGDSVVTAIFITATAISIDSAQGFATCTKVANCQVRLNATANYGYHFDHWSDGNTENPRFLTLTQDTEMTAYFAPNQYSIVGTQATGFTYSTDFQQAAGDNNWTIVNGTGNTNKWFIGSLGSGNRALYVSSDGGQNNTYRNNSSSAVFAYTTLSLPEGQHVYSYDWRCNGEGGFDYLRVALIPNNASLSTSGWTYNSLPSGAIALDGGSQLRGQSTWQTKSGVANVPSAGTYKVVFFWRNDNSGGSNPPAAVDNFSIGSATATLANSGTVTGSDTVDYLETVTLTAVPNYGYHFTQWHDGVTINPREVVAICNSVFYAIFDYDQFTLNVASSDTTQGTADGDGSYNYLSSRTIQATANTGYHFTQWSDGNTDNPRVVVLTRDTSFIAQFAPNQYTLAGSASYSERGTVEGVGAYNYLDTATLMAVPNHGYRFSRWGDNNYDNPRQVVVTQDKSYTAYFDYDQFIITLSVDDPAHGSVSGEGTYNYLANRTVRATENSGYYFAHWSDGSTANPYTFTLTSDTSLTAHYYALQVDSEDASKGSVSQTREGYCSAHIQATARTGYHFLQWSDGSTQNPRTVTLTQDTMITAYFAPNQYTLILRSSDVSLGSVSGGGTFDYGTEITISATVTAEHYHFAGWSDYSTENPRQYTILRDATLTAYFEIDRHTVAVQSSDITMGQVEGGGVFAYGQPCTVSATPYSGYEFVNWSDGSPYNPYTFAVQRDMVLTANFAPVGTHTYTITAVSDNTAMGTVSGGGTFASGTVATLTAIPAVGYQFDRWQDGNRDNPRTVTVTGNATYTAYFAETVGVEDVVDGEDVRVWSYDGRIHVVGAEGMDVNVYDILGRRVSGKRKVESGKLELTVPAGVYLVRIGDLPARKVVVIKR